MGGRLKEPWTALVVACLVALAAAPAADATFPGQNGKLAFERHSFASTYDSRTWTMNPDGSDLAPLGGDCPQLPIALPQWSPDGTKVLYVCWYDELRIINADGTGDEFFYYNTDYIEALRMVPGCAADCVYRAVVERGGGLPLLHRGLAGAGQLRRLERSSPIRPRTGLTGHPTEGRSR